MMKPIVLNLDTKMSKKLSLVVKDFKRIRKRKDLTEEDVIKSLIDNYFVDDFMIVLANEYMKHHAISIIPTPDDLKDGPAKGQEFVIVEDGIRPLFFINKFQLDELNNKKILQFQEPKADKKAGDA